MIKLLAVWLILSAPVTAQTLLEQRFRAATEAEAVLELTAAAPKTSWAESGNEAAVATLFVDGQYQQDVILFGGANAVTYQVLLGRVNAGEHALRVDFNRKQSAAKATTIEIKDAKITLLDRARPEFQALAHAPLLYARPNTVGRFSDVPLLAYYETERSGGRTIIRYSVIFSNEDGGTQSTALMARWGRATDIEWVYEAHFDAQGTFTTGFFQGVAHQTREFKGVRAADHPVLLTASDNNNFSDASQSALRFALRPIAVDLTKAAREELMDRHPWTYRVMTEELLREGRITAERVIGEKLADPRRYLYLDAAAVNRDAAVSFAVKLSGDPRWYTSDWGINNFKIDRSGYFRTTILLPVGATTNRIERLVVRCDAAGNPRSREEMTKAAAARCDLNAINKVFMLDADLRPGASLPLNSRAVSLQTGEVIEVYGGDATNKRQRR